MKDSADELRALLSTNRLITGSRSLTLLLIHTDTYSSHTHKQCSILQKQMENKNNVTKSKKSYELTYKLIIV